MYTDRVMPHKVFNVGTLYAVVDKSQPRSANFESQIQGKSPAWTGVVIADWGGVASLFGRSEMQAFRLCLLRVVFGDWAMPDI